MFGILNQAMLGLFEFNFGKLIQ